MEVYSAVMVYDSGQEDATQDEPAYVCIAHNLMEYDARKLSERLIRQYALNAHVVRHRNHHSESQAKDCSLCQLLFEEIIEKASVAAKGSGITVVTP